MATALYDGIETLGNVMIVPKASSHFLVRARIGQVGTVLDRLQGGAVVGIACTYEPDNPDFACVLQDGEIIPALMEYEDDVSEEEGA